MATATTVPPARPPTRTMTLPGLGRVVSRRSAKDPASGLTAYLVKEDAGGEPCNVSVALKRKKRYIGTVLKGHTAAIVDMEFLPTPPDSPVFTLGTCDEKGIVFLWFMRIAKDALGIDYAIKPLRKYSFYSLRKNESAFYNRIRLSGTPEDGTMVLVPNDGSSVRVIGFSCHPMDDPGSAPLLEAPAAVPQIEAPAAPEQPVDDTPVPPPPTENKATEQPIPTPQPLAQEDFARSNVAAPHQVGGGQPNDEDDIDRDPLNATFPRSRRVEETLVDDDITEAAARGAGISEPLYRSDAAVEALEDGGALRDDVEIYEEGEYEEEGYDYEEEDYAEALKPSGVRGKK